MGEKYLKFWPDHGTRYAFVNLPLPTLPDALLLPELLCTSSGMDRAMAMMDRIRRSQCFRFISLLFLNCSGGTIAEIYWLTDYGIWKRD